MDNTETLTKMFLEFLTLYKFVNKPKVAEMLKAELNTQQLLDIYSLTDGVNSTREISVQLTQRCSHVTIANIWKRWALKGIVLPAEVKGRFKAAFNLEEYGITQVSEEE